MNIDFLHPLKTVSIIDDFEGNENITSNCSKSDNHPNGCDDYPFNPPYTIIAGTL